MLGIHGANRCTSFLHAGAAPQPQVAGHGLNHAHQHQLFESKHARALPSNPQGRAIGVDFGGERIRVSASVGVRVAQPPMSDDILFGSYMHLVNYLGMAPWENGHRLFFGAGAIESSVGEVMSGLLYLSLYWWCCCLC